eukprot:m.41897 g.41897  ORF g.41897 m.41897 type:complete len:131 (+) comp7028_c0_seq1:173-565(+)
MRQPPVHPVFALISSGFVACVHVTQDILASPSNHHQRNQVMVRVGGGWMDLQEYLVSHARRRQTHSKSKQTRDAQEAVSSILNATTGPGLCSTRTKLPGGKKSKRRSPGKVKVTDVKPYAPESNGNFMFK